MHKYFIPYYICVQFKILTFKLDLIIYIFCLRIIIDPQSAMKGVFNIMSGPMTNWLGMAGIVLQYMIFTAKAVAANIPDQGSSLSR